MTKKTQQDSYDLPELRIGMSDTAVYIKDRYIHVYETGMSGTGKSALIETVFEQDCLFPCAKVLIDPSGFLAEKCECLAEDVIYCSLNEPVSINPMADESLDDNTILDILWEALNHNVMMVANNEMITVNMFDWFQEAIFYCLKHGQRSLEAVLAYLMKKRSSKTVNYAIDGLIFRIKMLLNDIRLRPIICGQHAINWKGLINAGATLIVDCRGMSGNKMTFVGNLITQGIKNYFRYSDSTFEKPLALYIDECHNFISPNFFDILKEGRKYKISAWLASQDLELIDRKLSNVMMNVGNIISFKNGHQASLGIARELRLKPDDIVSLEKYHFAYRTSSGFGIAKAPSPPVCYKAEKKLEVMEPESKWFELQSYQPS